MLITNVEVLVLDTGKDYASPGDAAEAHGVRYVCLVKVSTNEGITGWSDAETQPHVGHAIASAPSSGVVGFEGLASVYIGENPFERERLWQKAYRSLAYYGRSGAGMQMISAVDIALWDIVGKATGQPLHALLGANYRSHVTAYASTLFRPTPAETKEAVASYLDLGFRAIKFGWGVFGDDLHHDIALVTAAREAAGPDIDLMVDAGWYNPEVGRVFRSRPLREWVALVQELETLGVYWLEDFLHPENIEGYRAVSEARRTVRLAAGEQYAGYREFERLANDGHVDVLQPDLSRCGGLTVGRQVADLAMRRQIQCVPHAWLTDLLKAASLHLSAYLMDAHYLEYNVSSGSLLTTLCTTPITMENGRIAVPTAPGLGVEPDPEIVARFQVH